MILLLPACLCLEGKDFWATGGESQPPHVVLEWCRVENAVHNSPWQEWSSPGPPSWTMAWAHELALPSPIQLGCPHTFRAGPHKGKLAWRSPSVDNVNVTMSFFPFCAWLCPPLPDAGIRTDDASPPFFPNELLALSPPKKAVGCTPDAVCWCQVLAPQQGANAARPPPC